MQTGRAPPHIADPRAECLRSASRAPRIAAITCQTCPRCARTSASGRHAFRFQASRARSECRAPAVPRRSGTDKEPAAASLPSRALPFPLNEAAADREINLRTQRRARSIVSREPHGIRMPGQHHVPWKNRSRASSKGMAWLPRSSKAPDSPNRRQFRRDLFGVHARRCLAGKSQQNGGVGRMAFPGKRQRAVKFGADGAHACPSVSPRLVANSSAARIGPTVCELDGPTPILNRSKTLVCTA